MHVFFSVSMMTINKNGLRTPLKLVPHTMHGGETLCSCVCVSMMTIMKMPSGTFPYNYFFTSQTCTPYNTWSPQDACPARVMVVVLSVCLSASTYSRATGTKHRFMSNTNCSSAISTQKNVAILLKLRCLGSINRHLGGPHCMT